MNEHNNPITTTWPRQNGQKVISVSRNNVDIMNSDHIWDKDYKIWGTVWEAPEINRKDITQDNIKFDNKIKEEIPHHNTKKEFIFYPIKSKSTKENKRLLSDNDYNLTNVIPSVLVLDNMQYLTIGGKQYVLEKEYSDTGYVTTQPILKGFGLEGQWPIGRIVFYKNGLTEITFYTANKSSEMISSSMIGSLVAVK